MMELLTLMWAQLKHNTVLAFFAVLMIAGSNSFVAYESSRTNVNIEKITSSMKEITLKSEDNSKQIVKTQRDILALQEKMFTKDWEQDKVISKLYQDILENDNRIDRLQNEVENSGK